MDRALAVSLKMPTSQRTPTPYKIKVNNGKLTDLVIRIELTRVILQPRFSNFLINSTNIFSHVFILVTCFLRVTISLLCRSQGRTISAPFTS